MDVEIKKAKVITRSVRIELTKEQVEVIVAEHIMREHRSELRDFGLKVAIEAGTDGTTGGDFFACIVTGTATRES